MRNFNLTSSIFGFALRARRVERAFTLVEVLVAVSIFAIVMLVATGSVFSIVEANKKTHSLKSVMTNLNFALESMARDMRVGSNYSCTLGETASDCPSGGTVFSYRTNTGERVQYSLNQGRIEKTIVSSGISYPITASEISIENLAFYVIGTGPNDGKQPKVVLTVKGSAGTGKTKSDFHIQTTVTQRVIDA